MLVQLLSFVKGAFTLFFSFLATLFDPKVPLRVKIGHGALRLIMPLTRMHSPAIAFNRKRFEALVAASPETRIIRAEDEKACVCEDVKVNEHVSVRIFKASGAPPAGKSLTVLYYIHGGGFTILHNYNAHYHALCRRFAQAGPFVVVSLEYRLAPENPFPAAVVDAHAGLTWCATSSHALLADCGAPGKRRLVVGGDSAGGNLSAVLCLLARDGLDGNMAPAPRIPIAHQLLVYPSVHMLNTPSRQRFRHGYIVPKPLIDFFSEAYLGPAHAASADTKDIRIAPYLAASLRDLPPATIVNALLDPLLDDGRVYGRMLRERGGVDVKVLEYNSVHNFFLLSYLPEARKAMADVVQRILP